MASVSLRRQAAERHVESLDNVIDASFFNVLERVSYRHEARADVFSHNERVYNPICGLSNLSSERLKRFEKMRVV